MSDARSLLVILLTLAPLAHADVSGTVRGRIRILDNRTVSPNRATLGTLVPARRMVVAVVADAQRTCTGEDCLTPINSHFFAVTGDDGRFTVRWTDITRSGFPVPLRVKVMYISSEDAGGNTTVPPVLFSIVQWPETSPQDVVPFTAADADLNVSNVDIGAGLADDESAAYLTTREFFERIVARSKNLRERMPGLTVRTRVPGFGMFRGITPRVDEAWIADGQATASPRTVAHELGHAVTWAALQLTAAPINPLTDYLMNGVPGWTRDSREFSKAAFLEGMADLWANVWLNGQRRETSFSQGEQTFRLESGTIRDADGNLVLRCRTVDRAWEFPFCHTAALWDLLDTDERGDGVDLTTANLVDTLSRFPNGCLWNGCRDEPGLDGLNHLDFHRNARASLQTRILSVWQLNGISGGN